MTTIFAILVFYNKKCSDAPVCQTLAQCSGIHPIVLDNSTSDLGNEQYCRERDWHYLSMGGNQGLTKAYNAGVCLARFVDATGIVILLDDDAKIDHQYFDILNKSAKDYPDCAIFLPVLKAAGRIVSPSRLCHMHSYRLFRDAEQARAYQGKDLTALNSGMALRLSVFNDFQYDERLFLDCVDHWFMQHAHQNGLHWLVLDYETEHQLSAFQRPTRDAALHRFKILASDFRVYSQASSWKYTFVIGRRALKLAVLYADPAFVRMFLNRRKEP